MNIIVQAVCVILEIGTKYPRALVLNWHLERGVITRLPKNFILRNTERINGNLWIITGTSAYIGRVLVVQPNDLYYNMFTSEDIVIRKMALDLTLNNK